MVNQDTAFYRALNKLVIGSNALYGVQTIHHKINVDLLVLPHIRKD